MRRCRLIEVGEDARDTRIPVEFRDWFGKGACRKMMEGGELVESGH